MRNLNNTLFTAFLAAIITLFSGPADAQLRDRDLAEFSSVNVLVNPGFELGLVRWTSSGTAPTLTTTASEVALGKASASWDAAADGDTFSTQQYTLPNILEAGVCEASVRYNGGDANIDLKVVDGTSAVLGQTTLVATTAWTKAAVIFTCPTSGTVGFTFEANADAAELFVDSAVLGRSSDIVDQIRSTPWQAWTPTFENGSNIVVGSARYKAVGSVVFYQIDLDADANGSGGIFGITGLPIAISDNNPSSISAGGGIFTDNSAGENFTFEVLATKADNRLQLRTEATAPSDAANIVRGSDIDTDDAIRLSGFYEIDEEDLPAEVNPVLKIETSAYHFNAEFSSGTIGIGTVTQASYNLQNEPAATIETKANSLQVRILCDGGVAAAPNCNGQAVDELLGIEVTIPRAGNHYVCTSFQHSATENSGASEFGQSFRLDRIDAESSIANGLEGVTYTVLESSDAHTQTVNLDATNIDSQSNYNRICSVFKLPVGANAFTLSERTNVDSGILSANNVLAVSWQIFPIDQQLPQAVLVDATPDAYELEFTGTQTLTDAVETDVAGGSITLPAGTYTFGAFIQLRAFKNTTDFDRVHGVFSLEDGSGSTLFTTREIGFDLNDDGPTFTRSGAPPLTGMFTLASSQTLQFRVLIDSDPDGSEQMRGGHAWFQRVNKVN